MKWPEAIVLHERMEKGEISKEEYSNSIGNVPGDPLPNIKMIILSTTNPLMTHPDLTPTYRLSKKLDFCVVMSYHLDNPSARYADIVHRKCIKLLKEEMHVSELEAVLQTCLFLCRRTSAAIILSTSRNVLTAG